MYGQRQTVVPRLGIAVSPDDFPAHNVSSAVLPNADLTGFMRGGGLGVEDAFG
jgi:hypothetical protein